MKSTVLLQSTILFLSSVACIVFAAWSELYRVGFVLIATPWPTKEFTWLWFLVAGFGFAMWRTDVIRKEQERVQRLDREV